MQTVYPHNLSTYQQCVYLIILPQCMWLCFHSMYIWRRCRLWFFRFWVQLPIRLRRRLVLVRYVLCRRKAIESVLSFVVCYYSMAWLSTASASFAQSTKQKTAPANDARELWICLYVALFFKGDIDCLFVAVTVECDGNGVADGAFSV